MGVVIESDVWKPNTALYVFIFVSCFLSIFSLPRFSGRAATVFDYSSPPTVPRFQRIFLLLFSLSSVLEGLWSVFGEYELASYGASREQMVLSLSVGYAAALFFGTFLGVLSDIIGQKKVCLLFYMLNLFIAIWKKIIGHPSIYLAYVCLSLATSIFSFSFETWMVVEHDKFGHRKDTLNDIFWLMTFFESSSLIGSQVLANWIVSTGVRKYMISLSNAVVLLALIGVIFITRGWKEVPRAAAFKDYITSFRMLIFVDKRIMLLAWTQACVQFSIVVFWILWAPTIVADGREVYLGLIYPCLLGARMLGSTAVPWFLGGPLSFRIEDCLLYGFVSMGLVLSVVAYDYQDIGVLVSLFCVFHACLGLVLPSLARLRTMYVPNELRGGMISLSLAPANALSLLFLLQGGYYRNIGNSMIISLAALGLFTAASCMHMLKIWGKQQPKWA